MKVDDHGAVGDFLGLTDRGFDLFVFGHAERHAALGFGKFDEVGHVFVLFPQFRVGVVLIVEQGLPLANQCQGYRY